MTIGIESIEIVAAMAPTLLALYMATRRASKMSTWFILVVGTSALAVLSVGLLLSRLVAQCATTPPSCADGLLVSARQPGVFSSCFVCTPETDTSALAAMFNSWALPVQVAAAVLCVLLSVITTGRFIFWAKRIFKLHAAASQQQDGVDG